jgi:4'-phosphopantetheinyl transferase
MLFKLLRNVVDLWIVRQEDVQAEAECERCRAFLTDEERMRERRFVFPADRHLYLLTRSLVRVVLGQYLSAAPLDLVFQPNTYGRPQLLSPRTQSGMTFNVSHTRGVVVLGVGCHRELGVDVEGLERESLSDIADQFFAPCEAAALKCLPARAQHQRFFEYWTLKEAYIKARSMGLSLPLQQFAFEFVGSSGLKFTTDPDLADPPARWEFWQFSIDDCFLLAVCAERNLAGSPLIRATRLTPLLDTAGSIEISRMRCTSGALTY